MNTIFVGLHSFEYYPYKYYNDLVGTVSHCKSFSQTDKFVTLNLTGVELLADFFVSPYQSMRLE